MISSADCVREREREKEWDKLAEELRKRVSAKLEGVQSEGEKCTI